MGPAAAVSYLSISGAGKVVTASDRALCQRHEPALQQLYMQLRQAGDAEARRDGRGVVFASKGAEGVQAIERPDINACCLPGGLVFVHR